MGQASAQSKMPMANVAEATQQENAQMQKKYIPGDVGVCFPLSDKCYWK